MEKEQYRTDDTDVVMTDGKTTRKNTIGIVGEITDEPELIVDAADWERKVYETRLKRTRPSGTVDIYILQFNGRAAGSEEMLERITDGAEVLVGGEIRSENVRDPQPEENRVKIYIRAEVIVVNDPNVKDQNEVKVCGYVCNQPAFRLTKKRNKKGKRVAVTNMMVAVNSQKGTSYIPCVCFDAMAYSAETLHMGDYVEIYGRFQSRDYRKRIEGRELPYLTTVYEVCVRDLKSKKRGLKNQSEDENAEKINKNRTHTCT